MCGSRVTFAATNYASALTNSINSCHPLTRLPRTSVLLRVFPMVTFPPHLLHNSPRLNDLAIRSNEYLASKRFLLTTILFPAIERREDRAPACSAPLLRTPPFQIPPFRRDQMHLSHLEFLCGTFPNRPISFITTLLQTLCRRKINQLLCFQSIPHSCGKNTGVGCPCQLQASRFKPPERTSRLQNRTKP